MWLWPEVQWAATPQWLLPAAIRAWMAGRSQMRLFP